LKVLNKTGLHMKKRLLTQMWTRTNVEGGDNTRNGVKYRKQTQNIE